MNLEPGDRVRFKSRGLPKLAYHAPGDGVEHSWQEHFGGTIGCVVSVDTVNREVCVRGNDQHEQPYTVWISPDHLTLEEMGVPR